MDEEDPWVLGCLVYIDDDSGVLLVALEHAPPTVGAQTGCVRVWGFDPITAEGLSNSSFVEFLLLLASVQCHTWWPSTRERALKRKVALRGQHGCGLDGGGIVV